MQNDGVEVGLGCNGYQLAVYIANRPPLPEFDQLDSLRPLQRGELGQVVNACGNHWRKIFNLYAKLAFMLGADGYSSWQAYRDSALLQPGCRQALLFSPVSFEQPECIHIVAGRSYGKQLSEGVELLTVSADFSVSPRRRLIIAPYFDYRQLSNVKLQQLVDLVQALRASFTPN